MKKPKFKQIRGTPAHSLRHRIVLGITLGLCAFSYLVGAGATYLGTPDKPGSKLQHLEHPLHIIKRKKVNDLVSLEEGTVL